MSTKTQSTYADAARALTRYLGETGGPVDAGNLTREHLEEFIGHPADTRSASTASHRYRALQQSFKWCVEEEELDRSPMERMKAPIVPERPVDVLSEEQLKALLKACAGKDFEPRRGTAMIRLFADTGARRAEIANLTLDELDLDQDVIIVVGKGRRARAVPFGSKTSQALDRYMRTGLAQERGQVIGAVARLQGRAVSGWHLADARPARPRCRARTRASAPAPPHGRTCLACQRGAGR